MEHQTGVGSNTPIKNEEQCETGQEEPRKAYHRKVQVRGPQGGPASQVFQFTLPASGKPESLPNDVPAVTMTDEMISELLPIGFAKVPPADFELPVQFVQPSVQLFAGFDA